MVQTDMWRILKNPNNGDEQDATNTFRSVLCNFKNTGDDVERIINKNGLIYDKHIKYAFQMIRFDSANPTSPLATATTPVHIIKIVIAITNRGIPLLL